MSGKGYAETDRKMKMERPLYAWKRTFCTTTGRQAECGQKLTFEGPPVRALIT